MIKTSPNVLIILDGWGQREAAKDNAISAANTPVWDGLWENRPHCVISSSGRDVGLPEGQMGNSEVGHMNMGAGRVVHQDFTRINKAIHDGSFHKNDVLNNAMQGLVATGGALHLFGLLSSGGVHSHEEHIKAAVDLARSKGVERVFLHAFLDGRDVPPKSAELSLSLMQKHIKAGGEGSIVSVVGRYYAMDRDNRWERIAPAYRLITEGEAEYIYSDPVEALLASYDREETDEFVKPSAIRVDGNAITMKNDDAVLFMNFRADRARQLCQAFLDREFKGFKRHQRPTLKHFVTLTKYADDIPSEIAFDAQSIKNSLGEYIANLNLKQLRLAETEKYAHVTFFFSGGREKEFTGEERILVPSPEIATYDLKPQMSAPAVTDELVEAIKNKKYSLIVCNYANGDMVGHTGNFEAAVEAVECIDECLGRIVAALEQADGQCLITADHGNVEQMSDAESAQPHTAHTALKVPFIYVGRRDIKLLNEGGVLSDVAPTMIDLMGLEPPKEMTGRSLICGSAAIGVNA